MKVAVIRFPGTNCDRDVLHVLRSLLKLDARLVWHADSDLVGYDAAVLPGGFSYGDYLRAGIIAAHSPAVKGIKKMAERGKPILGICNGFQILVEAELLPGALLPNSSLRFVCRWVKVMVENSSTAFTCSVEEAEVLRMPVAHMQGRYFIDDEGLKNLRENRQVTFSYVDDEGLRSGESNPNGSLENIAGISNVEGNVVGLMPHPERSSEAVLSPSSSSDGLSVFQSMVKRLGG